MKKLVGIVVSTLILVSCSSDDGGIGPGRGNESTLGANFATYTELSETNNNSESTSEITSYVLDEDGLKIVGSFETTGASNDYYRFNTGNYATVTVHVFIDGVRQYEENSEISMSLNSYIDDGYSTLRGNGYFIRASVSPTNASFQDYVLGISERFDSNVAGSDYVIEMRGD
ncbi:hypothetical protein [Kaarinaea lacus]